MCGGLRPGCWFVGLPVIIPLWRRALRVARTGLLHVLCLSLAPNCHRRRHCNLRYPSTVCFGRRLRVVLCLFGRRAQFYSVTSLS